MVSVDDGYSSQEGRDEVLGLGVKVVSISGAKGKKLIEAPQWKSPEYRRARAERSAVESLVFTLKEGFEFAEMMRRSRENVLAEMLEKVLNPVAPVGFRLLLDLRISSLQSHSARPESAIRKITTDYSPVGRRAATDPPQDAFAAAHWRAGRRRVIRG